MKIIFVPIRNVKIRKTYYNTTTLFLILLTSLFLFPTHKKLPSSLTDKCIAVLSKTKDVSCVIPSGNHQWCHYHNKTLQRDFEKKYNFR